MIDPQLQANRWIKNAFAKDNLLITKFSDHEFMNKFKQAIENGYPILVEDVDLTIDPSIDTILGKQYYRDEDAGRTLIKLGDATIDYDPKFCLYITTKLPNPHFLPEVFIKTTIINFTVTFEGLEDQLLGDVVKNEKPEIEE
mmetsp:Transcript_28798/g.26014  ORF Transcript_28798/g.26014 Transcript_28798/m.26014 type:complete len:142 (-) Transcript_28798:1406-1831(-)